MSDRSPNAAWYPPFAQWGSDDSSVPMTELDRATPALLDELMLAVERVAFSSAFTLGEEVAAFEDEFAEYCGSEHAVGVSSGTDALALALRALDIGHGDEVIVPTNSFIATASAVALVGATVRLVDVDPDTHTITADVVEAAIGSRTKCVIPVHLYGRTVDMDPIVRLARDAGLWVIEDACQAHGAVYRGRRVGTFGDCGCFSFYPAKNLGAWGDGGAVTTRHVHVAERLRLLRSHGEAPRYHHRVLGTTGRLDAIQAAVLRVKLPLLEAWNDERRRLAGLMDQLLTGSAVSPPAPLLEGHDHVFHQYVVRTRDRDALRAHLEESGIATAVHYPQPIHQSPAFADLQVETGNLPVAETLAREICSLPLYPTMTDVKAHRVAAAVQDFQPRSSRFLRSAPARQAR
jgi:dTDP-3-amino-3,4,6-trideoxy-alpha-D-glucose transaminase